MFNYFHKYIRVHVFKPNKLNEEENETATIFNFLHLFTLHVTKKFSFNTLKTISLKIEKKTRKFCSKKHDHMPVFPSMALALSKRLLIIITTILIIYFTINQ